MINILLLLLLLLLVVVVVVVFEALTARTNPRHTLGRVIAPLAMMKKPNKHTRDPLAQERGACVHSGRGCKS